MHPINLLFVITKLELGGAQTQLLSLIRQLDRKRFRLFLYTGIDGILLAEAESIQGLTIKTSRYLKRPLSPLKDLLALAEAYSFIKKNNIALVHTHSSKAGVIGRLAARLAGAPCIVHTVHGWSFNDYQPAWQRKLFVWLERLCGSFTDTLVVVSDFDRRKGLAQRIAREAAYALLRYGIPSGITASTRERIRKEFKVQPDGLLVGTVACLKPQKSPQDFIRLAHAVTIVRPHVIFVLVGDGELRQEVEGLVSAFGLQEKVILTGWRRDVAAILPGLDVFVLTSLWEGLPIAVMEALRASLPVVVTDTGGVGEIISDGKNGFLARRGDVASVLAKLLRLLDDRELRERLGRAAGKSLGSDFGTEAMAAGHERMYQALLVKKGIIHAG